MNEICQSCGSEGDELWLEVHHIIPVREFEIPEEANTMDNLILLCRGCHVEIENGRMECPKPRLPKLLK
jgi:predicted HNH restriction endonuclease